MRSARKKHGKHNHVASFERAALVGCVSDGVAFWFPLVSRQMEMMEIWWWFRKFGIWLGRIGIVPIPQVHETFRTFAY